MASTKLFGKYCRYNLFITPEIVIFLDEKTSVYIKECIQNYVPCNKSRKTDVAEVKIVIGLLLLAGLYNSNSMTLDNLWNLDRTGIEILD